MVTRNRTARRGKLLKASAMVLNEGAKILALQYELFYAVCDTCRVKTVNSSTPSFPSQELIVWYFFLLPDWSLEIVDLCEEFRDRNVVGLDIAGDESMGEIPAMKEHIMAFQVSCPKANTVGRAPVE